MSKQREFEQPPKGHVGLLVYDSVTKKWYAVLGDDDGHIQLEVVTVALPDGAATALKQLANDHDVNVSNQISGFATALKQLANDHDVNVSNQISGFATTLKQLANDHDVNVSNADIEVVQPTPADLKMSQHQYDGATWRKSNLLWGYNDIWGENLGGTVSGTSYEDYSSEVSPNEVWIMQSISIRNGDGVCGATIIFVALAAGGQLELISASSLAEDEVLNWSGSLTLGEGDSVAISTGGVTNGNRIYGGVGGYKMKLNM